MAEVPAHRQAVVIGAGMGGLMAAGALVTLPAAAVPRAGTPQARHVHALLAGGLKALNEMFPGFENDLLRAGAVPLNGGMEIRVERPGFDPFPARDVGVQTCAASRPLIEFVLRRRVVQLPGVQIHAPCRVTEILGSTDGAAVTGVRYEGADGQARHLGARLVIDASGREALTAALLHAAGRASAPQTAIGIDIGYATATYEIPPVPERAWKGDDVPAGAAKQPRRADVAAGGPPLGAGAGRPRH